MKKNLHRTLLTFVLTLVLGVTSVVPTSATTTLECSEDSKEISSANSFIFTQLDPTLLTVGEYSDKYFTSMSDPEPMRLHFEAEYISLCAVCTDETKTETLYLHMEPFNDDSTTFSVTIPFEADGSTTTYPLSVPTGRYRLYFWGNSEEIHEALAVFSAYVYE